MSYWTIKRLFAVFYFTVDFNVTTSDSLRLKVRLSGSPFGAGQTMAHKNSALIPGLTIGSSGKPFTFESSSKTSIQDEDSSLAKVDSMMAK